MVQQLWGQNRGQMIQKPGVRPQTAPVVASRSPHAIIQRALAQSASLTRADVLMLQRTIGNQAVAQLLEQRKSAPTAPKPNGPATGPLMIQRRLAVGPAGDRYEREADRVAKQVVGQMNASPQPSVQRAGEEDEDEMVQAKPLANAITPLAQRDSEPDEDEEELRLQRTVGPEGGEVDRGLETSIRGAKGGGQPLPGGLQEKMGAAFGADFSWVKVHTGGQADALNRSLNAKAFTTGNDIFFRQGAYSPDTSAGQELIAHELTHTVQQGAADVQRDMIQRRIGFEVETGIPITEVKTSKKGRKHYYNIFAGKTKIGMTNGDMSPDHIPIKRTKPEPDNEHFENDLPIVEFVSDAIAENLSDEAFLEWAGDALSQLKDLKDDAKAASPPGDNTVLPRYNFGLPSDGITYEDRNWNRISVQATLDVGLAKVGSLVGKHGSGGQALGGSEIDQAQVAQRAGAIAESVLKAYEKKHWGQKKKDGRAEVKGLMTMIVHHLLIGSNVQAQKMIYAKNRLGGVMYKTKLSTLVRNMGGNAYWAKIMAKRTRRPKLINHLINLTGRAGDEPIYLGYTDPVEDRRGTDQDRSSASSDIDVRTWLREVLSGTDDKLFDELKNEWSEEIKPPRGIAAVEVRKPQSFLGRELQNVNLSLDNPDGVANYLLEIYKWNKTL